jgi:hypothetical protein
MRGDRGLQRIEDYPRLYPGQPGRRVDVEHRIEVAGEVEHYTGADGVTRYRRTSSSSGERNALLAAEGDHGVHIVDTAGQHYGTGWHPVVRGISGIERPAPGVSAYRPTHGGPQRAAEHVVIHTDQHGATRHILQVLIAGPIVSGACPGGRLARWRAERGTGSEQRADRGARATVPDQLDRRADVGDRG